MDVNITFDPYYYYPDGTNMVVMAGAYKVLVGTKTIGAADSFKQALFIKERYLKDLLDYRTN